MPLVHAIETWNLWVQQHLWWLVSGWAGLMALSIALKMARRARRQPDPAGYGSSTWATKRQVQQAGCFNDDGLILGMAFGRYVRSPREQNVVVFGPPGTGKSAGQVIPSILASQQSAIILDLSGDLVEQTHAARSRLGPTYIWDPRSPISDHLNPWDMVRWNTIHEVEDCQRLSSHIVKPIAQHTSSGAEHYERVADDLLTLASQYVWHASGICNGENLLDYFSALGRTAPALLRELEGHARASIRRGAARVLKQGPRRIEEQWSAAVEWITRWEDPKLAWNTCDTTIPWEDLQQSSRPMTVYLRLSPDDAKGRLNRLFRMVLDLMAYRITDRQSSDYTWGVDLIADDVAEVGDLPIIPEIASFKRKFGWCLMAVFQSPAQAWHESGRYSALLNACGCWVIHRQHDPDSAKYLAAKLGETTVVEPVERITRSWGRQTRSVGLTTHRRELMTVGEMGAIPDGTVIICVGPLRIWGQGLHVYSDRNFRNFLGGAS